MALTHTTNPPISIRNENSRRTNIDTLGVRCMLLELVLRQVLQDQQDFVYNQV